MTLVKFFFFTSKSVTYSLSIVFILIFIFETFYPLGNIVQYNFGTFGMMIGKLLGLYAWYIFGRSIYFVSKGIADDSSKME